ncbi:MAG: hypothetical protein AAGB32_02850 [Pseudomonadota bacterium]
MTDIKIQENPKPFETVDEITFEAVAEIMNVEEGTGGAHLLHRFLVGAGRHPGLVNGLLETGLTGEHLTQAWQQGDLLSSTGVLIRLAEEIRDRQAGTTTPRTVVMSPGSDRMPGS